MFEKHKKSNIELKEMNGGLESVVVSLKGEVEKLKKGLKGSDAESGSKDGKLI